jgi:hypothetical protein
MAVRIRKGIVEGRWREVGRQREVVEWGRREEKIWGKNDGAEK